MQQEISGSAVISLLVDNESGALARIVELFSGRGYNIQSLTVAPVGLGAKRSFMTEAYGANEQERPATALCCVSAGGHHYRHRLACRKGLSGLHYLQPVGADPAHASLVPLVLRGGQ